MSTDTTPETFEQLAEEFGATIEVESKTDPTRWYHTGPRGAARKRCQSCLEPITSAKPDYRGALKEGRSYIQCGKCNTRLGDTGPQTYALTLRFAGSGAKFATQYTRGSAHFNEPDPTPSEVLQALALDASCWLGSRNVDEFLEELGYDADGLGAIRQGEAAYAACGNTYKELHHMLGAERMQRLLDATE